MIEDLIELGKYKEALQYLTDQDDENVRYQRLICLYALKEYDQAYREGIKAKALAEQTYYDVVAINVSVLKELEKYEEAINIIVEELSMPYIPYQYETMFNAAYDDLLLAKQNASYEGSIQHVFNEEDIVSILSRDDYNEELLYMALEQLESMNVRRILPAVKAFISNNDKPDFAKSLLIEVMIDQEIDEEMSVVKNGISYDINPLYEPMVLTQEARGVIDQLLVDVIENDNSSLYQLCQQFLDFYLYTIYPRYIDDMDYRAIAAAIHYHLASLQYIDIEMEDIELDYNVDAQDVYDVLKGIQAIEY